MFFVRKEFLHVRRDARTLLILFAMPLTQILIFGFALTNEVKNTRIGILDFSKETASQTLVNQLSSSRYFDIAENYQSLPEAESGFRKGKIRMLVIFPSDFQEQLMHGNQGSVQLIADGTDPNVANTLINYASAIIRDYQQSLPGYQQTPYTIETELQEINLQSRVYGRDGSNGWVNYAVDEEENGEDVLFYTDYHPNPISIV